MNKQKKLIDLCAVVIRQDVLQGHLKWKVTDIARKSRVPRSRIYEVLGAGKEAMLKNALSLLLAEIYGLSPERRQQRAIGGPLDGIFASRAIVSETPELLSFYFRHRDRANEIGAVIRQFEKEYLGLVAEQTGLKDPDLLLFIRTAIHGISVAPFLSKRDVQMCLETLFKLSHARFNA